MTKPIIEYFDCDHLPPKLQRIALPICILADDLQGVLPDCPEKSAGMRKLLEAKDCFVRAAIVSNKPTKPISREDRQKKLDELKENL